MASGSRPVVMLSILSLGASCARGVSNTLLFKLFKQSSPRDSQFLRGERKSVCRDVVCLVGRRVLRARERGVSNTLLGDHSFPVLRDRIGLDSY